MNIPSEALIDESAIAVRQLLTEKYGTRIASLAGSLVYAKQLRGAIAHGGMPDEGERILDLCESIIVLFGPKEQELAFQAAMELEMEMAKRLQHLESSEQKTASVIQLVKW